MPTGHPRRITVGLRGGYIVAVNGSAVAVRSILQRIVTLSSMESEYVTAGEAAKEVVWMRQLLKNLGFPQKHATDLWEDNRAAICFSEAPTNHHRTKHIDVRHHWLRQLVSDYVIKLRPIRSHNQVADILTKNTEKGLFLKLRDRLVGALL